MTLDEVLAELATDVREVLGDRKVRTHDDKTAAIVKLFGELLAPGAVAALDRVGGRVTVDRVRYHSGTVCVDANGDLVGVELDEPFDIEWHGRQE